MEEKLQRRDTYCRALPCGWCSRPSKGMLEPSATTEQSYTSPLTCTGHIQDHPTWEQQLNPSCHTSETSDGLITRWSPLQEQWTLGRICPVSLCAPLWEERRN